MLEYALVGSGGPTLFQRCYDYHMMGGINATMSFTCSFSGNSPGDNGNAYQIQNKMDDNRTQNYVYDSLNRIQQGYTNGSNWGQTFTIDPWGNLTNVDGVAGKTNPGALAAAPATTKNQLTGYTYDAAGNLSNDNLGHAFTYDAENRIVSTAGATTYVYDGDGKRVVKCAGTYPSCTSGTLYWTGVGSDTLSETALDGTLSEDYFYFNGLRVARVDRPGNVEHIYLNDHLGTARMVATPTGSNTVTYSDSDYSPYGIEVPVSGSDPNRYKFTGKERDTESGLDNFGARYYTSNQGRFLTPDWSEDPEPIPYADLEDPQSLNLYSYVRNNPLGSVDDDGHECKQDPKTGNIVCHVSAKGDDDPKIFYAAGFLSLENEELGPYAWAGAALFFSIGCIQTHCWQPLLNQNTNDSNSTPPADASSNTSKTASPNPDPNQQKGKPDDKKKADDQIRGRLKNSKSYASEYGSKTYGEIKDLAKQGDPKAKAMKKLIEQSARLMEKVGNK